MQPSSNGADVMWPTAEWPPSATQERIEFRNSVRRFVQVRVAPQLEDWRHRGAVPRDLVAEAGAHGFLGTAVPDRFGGGDVQDCAFLAILIDETVNAGAVGLATLWALHAGVTIQVLLEHADPATQERWLPGLVAGELIGIPSSGTSPASLPGGRLADLLLVRTEQTVTVLPTDSAGVEVDVRSQSLAAPEAGIADVDASSVDLGAFAQLPRAATTMQQDVDLWLTVVARACARRALTFAKEYANNRKVFGHLLGEFENTQFRLAELEAELSVATTYVDHCLSARTNAALRPADAAAARYVTIALSDRCVDQSLQLHGGYGYMREYPVAQAFADARFVRTVGRLSSDPRRTVIAELFNSQT